MTFLSVPKTIECVVVALCLGLALWLMSLKPLGIMQACGYSEKKFLSWLKRRGNLAYERYLLTAGLCILSYCVIALCFRFVGEWSAVVGLVAYAIFFVTYIVADKRIALRAPAVKTPRLTRLRVVHFVVCLIVSYAFVALTNFLTEVIAVELYATLRYAVLSLLPVILLPLVCLSDLVAKIYEVPHNNRLIKTAKNKLANSSLRVVGITGSYGKTSTKNFLAQMLAKKYRVLSTPRSHNTPLGLALTINQNDLSEYDVFIAEMGARHLGDIAELCAICPPELSIITGICPQHLESFGSIENIVKAKGEILSATKDHVIVAQDCFDYFAQNPVARCANAVSDVSFDCHGTDFTLTLGEESVKVHTKLLGAHTAYNFGVAATVAYELGVSLAQIKEAIEQTDFVEHRLQLIESNGVYILDDGYNGNVKGAECALNVLKTFPAQKVVVTPGLIELGVLEETENRELGKKLVGFDKVILVGSTLVTTVKNGYLKNGGNESKITIVPDLATAQEQLKSCLGQGDAVLFLNDLPDVW